MRVEKYGPASERLSDEQLELLEQEPGVSQAEVQAESERAQLQLPLKGPKQRPVRQALPAELPRIEQLIALPAARMRVPGLWQREGGHRLRDGRATRF
jgi:transposase